MNDITGGDIRVIAIQQQVENDETRIGGVSRKIVQRDRRVFDRCNGLQCEIAVRPCIAGWSGSCKQVAAL